MEWLVLVKIVVPAAYMVLEYWLGKTDKTKAGSVLEVITEVAKAVVQKSDTK
jgi:hypothetical protein